MIKKRRNSDVTAANLKRTNNADEFANHIIEKLWEFEELSGHQFKSLKGRAYALNSLKIKTRRGSKWSAASVRRILLRAKGSKKSEP